METRVYVRGAGTTNGRKVITFQESILAPIFTLTVTADISVDELHELRGQVYLTTVDRVVTKIRKD